MEVPSNSAQGPSQPHNDLSTLSRRRQNPPPPTAPMPGQPLRWSLQPPTTPVLRPYRPSSGGFHQHNRPEESPRDGRARRHAASSAERDGWSPERPAWKSLSTDSSNFRTASPALDMSFLEWFPKGEITISYPNASGTIQRISGVNRGILEDRSALLSSALDGNGLHLEAVSHLTIKPFMQFVYTGVYTLPTPSGRPFEDVPTSLLVHCHMYRLGDIYAMPDLKTQAYANIVRQCEYGCSSPDAPIHLCQAIEYVYNNMGQHADVIETIVAYCVSCFSRHRLGTSFDFRRIAYDLRPFHQDLCKVSMERRFEDDDTAQAIIQMPFKPYAPAAYASRNDERARQVFDDVYHFHGDDRFDNSHKRRPSDASPGGNTETRSSASGSTATGASIASPSSRPQNAVGSSTAAEPSHPGMHTLTPLLTNDMSKLPSDIPSVSYVPTKTGATYEVKSDPLPLRPAWRPRPTLPEDSQGLSAALRASPGRATPAIQKSVKVPVEPKAKQSSPRVPPKTEMEPIVLATREKSEASSSPNLSKLSEQQSDILNEASAQAAKPSGLQEQVKEEDVEIFEDYKFVPCPVKTFAFETEPDHDFVKVDLTPTTMAMGAEKLRPGSPYFNITDPSDWPDAANSEDSEWDLV